MSGQHRHLELERAADELQGRGQGRRRAPLPSNDPPGERFETGSFLARR